MALHLASFTGYLQETYELVKLTWQLPGSVLSFQDTGLRSWA
jgi:hypothetical protein